MKGNTRSKSKMDVQNPQWRGDKVGYNALHDWVKRRLEKPEKCDRCSGYKHLDLANKGTYNRDLKNWWWLCRKCHMETDGRVNNLNRGGASFSGRKHTLESRKKMSVIKIGKSLSPESKSKISTSLKKLWESGAYKNRRRSPYYDRGGKVKV